MSLDTYRALRELFVRQAIPFKEINHAPGASAQEYHDALGCRYEEQAKCVFVKVSRDSGEHFAVVAVPALRKVPLKSVARVFGGRKARLATADEMLEHTGCSFGELPPIGTIFELPLVMHRDLLQEQEIFMNAGLVDRSFVVDPRCVRTLEDPIVLED